MKAENQITKAKNVLIVLSEIPEKTNDLQFLMEHFCGTVVKDNTQIPGPNSYQRVYVCGNLEKLPSNNQHMLIIKELSYNDPTSSNFQTVSLGEVPVVIHHAGIYFRRLFDGDDLFSRISAEHAFQNLTESNKQATALRKGIYLTNVSKETSTNQDEILHYRLLRCSSNLTGPTDNFRATDRQIMQKLNEASQYVFEQEVKLNHVLAQIYENKLKAGNTHKEAKAKISAHSDKTKDMPKEGLIAFCTFYDQANFDQLKPSSTDPYDWCYKQTSGLTRLHFKLKDTIKHTDLTKEFSVTLYPNSAFLIPLSTNRLYTHEIRPSVLNIDKIPVRMGYVARCSNLEAVHMNDQTFIKENGELIKLEQMTQDTMDGLRDSYYEENKTENMVDYGKVHFSMNAGDYQKPIY